MKLFPTGHATHPQWRMAAALVLAQLRAQMALPDYASAPTLGLLYITDHYANEAQALLDYLSSELPEVTDWSGTVGVGVSANNAEYFDEPALSVMLFDVPADQYRVFSGVAPLPAHAPHAGAGFVAHTALVHADGHTPELAELLTEMAARTDTGYLFGGLSASRTASVQFAVGGDGNMAGQGGASGVFDGGLSGVAFGAGVSLVSRVTQGCQPVGALHTITAAQENVVLALDGEPALDVLLDTLQVSLDSGDPQPALRKVRATLAGLVSAGSSHRASAARATLAPTRACAISWGWTAPAGAWPWPTMWSPACTWRSASATWRPRGRTSCASAPRSARNYRRRSWNPRPWWRPARQGNWPLRRALPDMLERNPRRGGAFAARSM